jgi:NADPH:quinone reductase-like Zn-dependent oxidoreductase
MSMMAVRAHRRGGPEVLRYEPAPTPAPAAGEVLVAVHAAAITFAELDWDETWTSGGRDRTPTVPSHEFSGVVTARAHDVTDVAEGDEVYGLVPFDRDGAAAEYVAVPAGCLAPRPRTVPHVVAAAVPLAALTAWQALVDHARVRPGERVLVHGGAGGVGAFTTQLAAGLEAEVTATAFGADLDLVRSLGATRAIDVATEQFDAEPGRYDVVVDTVGGSTLDRSYAVLRPGGRLVTLQAPPAAEALARHRATGFFFIVSAERSALTELAALVDAGRLAVTIARTFPLAEGRAAFDSRTSLPRRPGKTVLVVRE